MIALEESLLYPYLSKVLIQEESKDVWKEEEEENKRKRRRRRKRRRMTKTRRKELSVTHKPLYAHLLVCMDYNLLSFGCRISELVYQKAYTKKNIIIYTNPNQNCEYE